MTRGVRPARRGWWRRLVRRTGRRLARPEIPLAVEPVGGAGDDPVPGLDLREVTAQLRATAVQFHALHAASHGAITKARLAPCVGAPTPCRVLESDDRARRAVRVRVGPGASPGQVAIEVSAPGGSPVQLEPIDVTDRPPDALTVADEAAAKIWTAAVPDLPVTTWRNAGHFGRGLLAWAAAIDADRTLTEAEFASVRADLAEALRGDARNPVVHYNLGALLYQRYSEQLTQDAISHFTVAFSASFHDDDPETLFVAGLSLTGLSLSYAQLFHRFGHVRDEVLVNCRITASRAVEMLGGLLDSTGDPALVPPLLRARHAEAFSLHVTEQPADVEAAIVIYEDVVAGWEGFDGRVPAVVLNNLGYQYMALEGRDEPGCAPEAYDRAAALFERAIAVEHDFEMAWANLGNVQRLLKQHAAAEASYRNAAAAADSQGRKYPPAHSEIARLFLEQGRVDEAEAEHRRALDLTESPPAAAKVHGEWADALQAVNRDREALAAAERGLAQWPGEPRCTAVVARLQANRTEHEGAR